MLLAAPATTRDDCRDDSVDSAVSRLTREFAHRLDADTVTLVVETAREQLRGSPLGAMPELVERLARHRLADGL